MSYDKRARLRALRIASAYNAGYRFANTADMRDFGDITRYNVRLAQLRFARVASEPLEEQMFRNPDTGNKVKFKSLPPEMQARIRKQQGDKGDDEKGKGKGKGKGESKKDVQKRYDDLDGKMNRVEKAKASRAKTLGKLLAMPNIYEDSLLIHRQTRIQIPEILKNDKHPAVKTLLRLQRIGKEGLENDSTEDIISWVDEAIDAWKTLGKDHTVIYELERNAANRMSRDLEYRKKRFMAKDKEYDDLDNEQLQLERQLAGMPDDPETKTKTKSTPKKTKSLNEKRQDFLKHFKGTPKEKARIQKMSPKEFEAMAASIGDDDEDE